VICFPKTVVKAWVLMPLPFPKQAMGFACMHMPANMHFLTYIVKAKAPEDVQAALSFAREHSIQVVVKTTGHSYQHMVP
jgi:hypothetical protein